MTENTLIELQKMSLDQVKALGFDIAVALEKLNFNLRQVREELARRESEPSKSPAKETVETLSTSNKA